MTRPGQPRVTARAVHPIVWLALFMAIVAPRPAEARFWTWDNPDGSVTLVQCPYSEDPEDLPEILSIPKAINGRRVSGIGDEAFSDRTTLVRVIIPDSVTTIGAGAFSGCTSLTSVTIPESVSRIGSGAFRRCANLAEIRLPPGVTVIEAEAFAECVRLPTLAIPARVTRIDDEAFRDCRLLGQLTLPPNLRTIGNYAFSGCPRLNLPLIPDQVYWIGERAFDGCESLQLANLGKGLRDLGNWAFCGCTGLKEITIPEGITALPEGAFQGCSGLARMEIPRSVTQLGAQALGDCPRLTAVCFAGAAPTVSCPIGLESGTDECDAFGSSPVTVYFQPGAVGWQATFNQRPTAVWTRPQPVLLDAGNRFGPNRDGFGFVISWAHQARVVIESCTDLRKPAWIPLSTNTLKDGSIPFHDPEAAKRPTRFYRIREP